MKQFEILDNRIEFDFREGESGKHCFVHVGDLAEKMSEKYGREVGVKVFFLPEDEIKEPEDFYKVKWGDDPPQGQPRKNNTIFESSQIQNIMAWHDKSTRVYGLETVLIDGRYQPAQIIEVAKGDFYHTNDATEIKKITDPINDLGIEYGFKALVRKVSLRDIIGGKFIDVHPYYFDRPYLDTVKARYFRNVYGKVYYQDIPELGMHGGPRKSADREKYLGLERIDFKGKKVADIGCAGGYFCRYASGHGAKRVTGYDFPDQVDSARNVANYLGYWNDDYIALNLTRDQWDVSDCDIVFYLSLNFHIGIPKQILEAKMLIFEDNGKESRAFDKLGEPWTSNFSRIEFIGRAVDHGDKAIYHLYK